MPRVEVWRRVAETVEFRVQHANDFGGFIVDDRAFPTVPQYPDSGAAGETGAGGAVDLMDMEHAADWPKIVEAARIGPALPLGKVRLQDRGRFLEPLQLAYQHGAVRPRAGRRRDEIVAARLRLEPGRPIARHAVAKPRFRPHKAAVPTYRRRIFVVPDAIHQHAHRRSPPLRLVTHN
jgi:hypothetical protein